MSAFQIFRAEFEGKISFNQKFVQIDSPFVVARKFHCSVCLFGGMLVIGHLLVTSVDIAEIGGD